MKRMLVVIPAIVLMSCGKPPKKQTSNSQSTATHSAEPVPAEPPQVASNTNGESSTATEAPEASERNSETQPEPETFRVWLGDDQYDISVSGKKAVAIPTRTTFTAKVTEVVPSANLAFMPKAPTIQESCRDRSLLRSDKANLEAGMVKIELESFPTSKEIRDQIHDEVRKSLFDEAIEVFVPVASEIKLAVKQPSMSAWRPQLAGEWRKFQDEDRRILGSIGKTATFMSIALMCDVAIGNVSATVAWPVYPKTNL